MKIRKVRISSLSPSEFDAEARVAAVLAEVDVHLLGQQRRGEGERAVGEGHLGAVVPAGEGNSVHRVVDGHCVHHVASGAVGVQQREAREVLRLAGFDSGPAQAAVGSTGRNTAICAIDGLGDGLADEGAVGVGAGRGGDVGAEVELELDVGRALLHHDPDVFGVDWGEVDGLDCADDGAAEAEAAHLDELAAVERVLKREVAERAAGE